MPTVRIFARHGRYSFNLMSSFGFIWESLSSYCRISTCRFLTFLSKGILPTTFSMSNTPNICSIPLSETSLTPMRETTFSGFVPIELIRLFCLSTCSTKLRCHKTISPPDGGLLIPGRLRHGLKLILELVSLAANQPLPMQV